MLIKLGIDKRVKREKISTETKKGNSKKKCKVGNKRVDSEN